VDNPVERYLRERYPLTDVIGGCKVCGKRMQVEGASPLLYRTCDDCKAKQQREQNRRLAAKRKAERHARKQEAGVPLCQHCGKPIEGAVRFSTRDSSQFLAVCDGEVVVARAAPPPWARKYCGNSCRQAAFRAAKAAQVRFPLGGN
jgi:hypothetical protein